jgi:hypothetical protein
MLAVIAVSVAASATAGGASSAVGPRPSVAEIKAQTRSAVVASRAKVAAIRVVGPNQRFAVRIEVADPAAYLKHRVGRVVAAVNRLAARRLFRSRTFAVVNRSGRVVFSITHTRSGSTTKTRWSVRPDMEDCARGISFNIQIDPNHAAAPCPA